MAQRWITTLTSKIFGKKKEEPVVAIFVPDYENFDLVTLPDMFKEKYDTIIKWKYDETYPEKLDWLNKNSAGTVEVTVLLTQPPLAVAGFKDTDDALVFKIKFGV